MPRNPKPEDTNDPQATSPSPDKRADEPTPPQAGGGLFLEGAPGPTTEGTTDPGAGWIPPLSDSPSGPSDVGPGSRTGSKARSTRSSGGVKKRDLRDVAAAAVQTVGGLVHTVLTRPDTPERDAGLWLPDPDDTDNIADPLAGLASRRVPEGADNPDAGDVVRLVLAVLAYLVKQVSLRSEVGRRAPVEPDYEGPEDPDQTGPSPDQGRQDDAPRRPAAVSALLGRRSGLVGVPGDEPEPGA